MTVTMNRVRGFALIFALMVVALIVLVAAAFQIIALNDLSMAAAASDGIRASYIASAGIAKKFMELRSGNTAAISNESFTHATGDSGSFSATATLIQPSPFATYRLDSAGRYKNSSRRITMDVKQVSFARFAYFSNSENQLFWMWRRPIWFVTGDRLTGPLHTNDQLNISGDPIFDGPVSSVNSSINYYHGGPPEDNPTFNQSLALGVPGITFPTIDMVNSVRTAAQSSDGLYLTGETSITLLPDTTMSVTNVNRDWVNEIVPMPVNNAIFVDNGNANISGILNGQLTIGTNSNIVIKGDLLYNTDPRLGSSTDMLGLISQNNVIISSSAPYDLEIDAYIVALNNSFTLENYWTGLKGMLTLYGGITQKVRGPIGTFNGSTNEKVSGYTKDYHYDERLADTAPAYFPPATDNDNRVLYKKVIWVEY